METSNFAFDVYCILGLESTCPDGWWMVGWVAGLAENIANSAQLKLEFGLSLAIVQVTPKDLIIKYNTEGCACRVENVRLDRLKSGLNMDKI